MANIERLQKLHDLLGNLKTEFPHMKFDINDWSKPDDGCGTAACAVGFACIHPWFNEQGLIPVGTKHDWWPALDPTIFPGYPSGALEAWVAIRAFFELDHRTAEYLFSGYRYREDVDVTPEMVQARIMEVINTSEPTP